MELEIYIMKKKTLGTQNIHQSIYRKKIENIDVPMNIKRTVFLAYNALSELWKDTC